MNDGRLIRECPTPYKGGTCGCGCDCTSPEQEEWEDERTRLHAVRFAALNAYRIADNDLELFRRTRPYPKHPS